MNIETPILLEDLKSLILGELTPICIHIQKQLSGKEFKYTDVLDIMNQQMKNDCIEPEMEIKCDSVDDLSEQLSDVSLDKPKRKYRKSGLTIFKQENKEKIKEEYYIRKQDNSELKQSTISAELWLQADQSYYNNKASILNE